MKARSSLKIIASVFLLLLTLVVSQCTSQEAADVVEAPTEVSSTAPEYKLAVIMPGPIEDADFNSLGYAAVQRIRDVYGIDVDYSEKVPVADAERVGREYIGSGYNIIAYHGGQFVAAAQTLAQEFPETTFFIYSAGQNPDIERDNIWNVGLRYFPGSYPLGVLAAKMTETGKVAFIAGIKTPIFIAALNSYYDGIKATDPSVEVVYNFTGDQNDAVKARQTAEAMIGDGADVIAVYLNQGVFGVHEAVLSKDSMIYVMTINTDKSESAPDNYLTSLVANFADVWEYIVGQVMEGKPGGYYDMSLGSGLDLAPYRNTPEELQDEVNSMINQYVRGEVTIEEDSQNLP